MLKYYTKPGEENPAVRAINLPILFSEICAFPLKCRRFFDNINWEKVRAGSFARKRFLAQRFAAPAGVRPGSGSFWEGIFLMDHMNHSETGALAEAAAALDAAEAANEAVLCRHIANGVVITSRQVYIEESVEIAPGARILPGTTLRGATKIGPGCVIGPNSLIEDSEIGEGTTVNASQVYCSKLGPHNNIGPFTHVRVNTVTDYGVHLGAYVETKNSNFARGNTVSHLTYIGDSDVGKYCNFGCGTVTCNYDGENKYRTTIGDYCFIGCNTNLVAPVSVGDGAYTAAGSTIGKDVPAGALAIERGRQANLEGWAVPKMADYIAKKKKLEEEGK